MPMSQPLADYWAALEECDRHLALDAVSFCKHRAGYCLARGAEDGEYSENEEGQVQGEFAGYQSRDLRAAFDSSKSIQIGAKNRDHMTPINASLSTRDASQIADLVIVGFHPFINVLEAP